MRSLLLVLLSATSLTFGSVALASDKLDPSDIISTVFADWNSDGNQDMAVLIKYKPGDASLLIYMSDDNGKRKLALKVEYAAWNGGGPGREPRLSLNKKESIVMHSGNESIGRNRWQQKMTIVYRNKKFLIAGYTYSYYDTLNHKNTGECDVNYLAGKVIKNKKTLYIKNVAPPLAAWHSEKTVKICGK